MSVFECILPLWVLSTSRHRTIKFTPCPVGPSWLGGPFLSARLILMIRGPYLPRLCLTKDNRMLGWPCHYRQQRLRFKLFSTLPSIPIMFSRRRTRRIPRCLVHMIASMIVLLRRISCLGRSHHRSHEWFKQTLGWYASPFLFSPRSWKNRTRRLSIYLEQGSRSRHSSTWYTRHLCIFPTVQIDTSRTSGKVENVNIGANPYLH
jgi:hypothetical protein